MTTGARPVRVPWRVGVGAFAAGAVAVIASGLVPHEAAAQTAVLTLKGGGTSTINTEITSWGDALSSTSTPIDLSYIAGGSGDAWVRSATLNWDYLISGLAPSAEDLNGRQFISAPISATALVPVISWPSGLLGSGWFTRTDVVHDPIEPGYEGCDPADPEYPANPNDPDKPCLVITDTPFDSAVKIPPENLAAMALNLDPAFEANGLAQWDSPPVQAAMGPLPYPWTQPQAFPLTVMRTEQASTNFYVQEYASELAPTAWDLLKRSTNTAWEPIKSRLPFGSLTRTGIDGEVSYAFGAGTGADDAFGRQSTLVASHMVLLPSGWVDKTIGEYTFGSPSLITSHIANPRPIEVMNKAGEYLSATKETISAALEAGGDEPLYATKNNAPGAYPLVWVNKLYAPASGLSINKTDALAASIRYIATTGQAVAEATSGAALTPKLVADALAAADQLVTSNCEGSDRTVASGPANLIGPDTPEVQALGDVKWCAAIVAPPQTTTTEASTTTSSSSTTSTSTSTSTTTTTSPPTTHSSSGSGSGTGGTQAPSRASPTTRNTVPATTVATTAEARANAPPPSAAPQATTPPAPTTSAPPPKKALPFGLPSDGKGTYKPLGTFAMGAGLFLFGRKVLIARFAAGA